MQCPILQRADMILLCAMKKIVPWRVLWSCVQTFRDSLPPAKKILRILPIRIAFSRTQQKSPGAQRIAEKHSRQGDITDLDIIVAPLVEQLNAALLGQNLLGKDWEGGDLDVPVVGHVDCSEGFVGKLTGLSFGD